MLTPQADQVAKPHPAPFSPQVLEAIEQMLAGFSGSVLDPFAGIGGVHELARPERQTFGVEIEPEWASQHPGNICADARYLPFPDGAMDAIVTSPAYGNRMADHHDAQERCRPCEATGEVDSKPCKACGGVGRREHTRITYRHRLGRPLTDGNSGAMQWGKAYRELHAEVWQECVRVLRPEGKFVLNISDHVRKGKVMPVTAWHTGCLAGLGIRWDYRIPVETPRMRFGKNSELRLPYEDVYVGTFCPV